MFVGWLAAWVERVSRAPRLTLAVLAALTLVLGWVAVERFKINSDLSRLIRQDAPWRVDFDYFQSQFPDMVKTAVVVVSGDSLKAVENASRDVVDYLVARPELFTAVAAPGLEPFFRDHALLYLEPEQLDDTADRLAAAQPWLSAVARDPSLVSILDLVEDGLQNEAPEDFARVLDLMADSFEKALAGEDGTILWADEIFPLNETRYQLIFLKPVSNFGATLPDARVVEELRAMVASLTLAAGIDVSLTGEITLQHEEIEAALGGVSVAGWLALALLFLVLVVGVRSGRIIAATFLLLGAGVLWTSAYAMLAVGEYNTLSVVFVVMFFGLGVDFALHFSLRLQEAINAGDEDIVGALVASTRSVGKAISLCTLTTAVGFLSFWPTEYKGLADLGVISAGGMLVAWLLTFTLLPAFYAAVGPPRSHSTYIPSGDRVVQWLVTKRVWVLACVAVGGLVAAVGAAQMRFDYSVLALKDPESESMSTLRELQGAGVSTDYSLVVVKQQPVDKEMLEQLAVVKEVVVPADLVPKEQNQSLFVLEDLQEMLFDALEPNPGNPRAIADVRARVEAVAGRLASLADAAVPAATIARLDAVLTRLSTTEDRLLVAAQTAVVGDLIEELDWIRRALTVSRVEFDDLPASARARVLSGAGESLSIVIPSEDTAPVEALSRFIDAVREVEPNATGRPVLEWGVGGIVVTAFQQALLFAAVGISLILVMTLRNVWHTVLVLVPLALAALSALAVGVGLGLPINMANILVLPLIFGLGVDNGIHVVERYLGEGDVDHLMHSSTPRAVMLSTLTTIGAFASLMLSPHQGTASIGSLLTIAVGLLLVFTIVLLPVLLAPHRVRA